MSGGFIKVHRKICKWEWYQDGNTFRLFMHLLLNANHSDKNWQGMTIARGQIVTGRKSLAESLDLSEQQIRTSINKLISTNEITSKSTNRFTVITLVNYSSYQDKDDESTKKKTKSATNKQPTDNHKQECKESKEHTASSSPCVISSDWTPNQTNQSWLNDSGLSEIEQQKVIRDFRDFWRNAESKRKNWDLAFRKNPIVCRAVNIAFNRVAEQSSYGQGGI